MDPIQIGLEPSHLINERDIRDSQLPEGIGVKWKDLARALDYFQSTIDTIEKEKGNSTKECCIELLVRWYRREGTDATAGRLADALTSIELRNLADSLIRQNDPSQIDEFQKKIREMKNQLVSLEAEGSKLSARNKELEEENQKLRARNRELEDARQHEQEDLATETDQATREHLISVKLKDVNEQLLTYVTSPLQVPEVKQDQLKTPVKLDLLTKLSERLQELYTEIQGMIAETCKCSEDLKRDFYDFAYHGLRAEHNDLVHRVNDLESALEEMSEDEKKDFERLQGYQVNRQRQVERLDKLWRGLFSSPECLPKTPLSAPTRKKPSDDKKIVRHTDPGARPKQPKPQVASSDDRSDEVSRLNLTKKKSTVESVIQTIFGRKESGEKQCSDISHSPRRDS